MRLAILLTTLLPLAACRRDPPAPAAAPAEAASSANSAADACPAAPAWARDEPAGLLIEVLYVPGVPGTHVGTGYRLFEDGRLDTFGDIEFYLDDAGKAHSRRIPAEWRTEGGVGGEALDRTRKVVDGTARDELDGWTKGRPHETKPIDLTVVRARQGGTLHHACYLGDPAPPALGALESAVKELVAVAKSRK